MFWLLTVNLVIEGATGLAILANPAAVYPAGDALTFSVARSFGIAACALAVLSGMMLRLPKPSAAVQPGLVTLAFFHTCLAAVLVPAATSGFTPLPVVFVHATLAVAFIVAVVTRQRQRH
jgi:hypothetical protein